tara:strand:- start:73 stop:516 length:444 start_codon:yes stop_codon:yes gene_type:complete
MSNVNANTIRAANGSLGTDIRIKNTSVYESDGGTSVTQNLVQGLTKSWSSFVGTGTVALRDSLNTASITDRGTGAYTHNISSAMGNGNYSCTLTSPRSASGNQVGIFSGNSSDSSAPTTTAVQMNEIAGSTFYDVDLVSVNIVGDLA